jgi:xylulose-5-phosphate/fructose-6-phosphate phosphoketolase
MSAEAMLDKSMSRQTRPRSHNEITRNEEPMRQTTKNPLSSDLLRNIHAYWRAANYLSVGQMYLYDNPALISDGTLKMARMALARA